MLRVREWREKRGLSQWDLARSLGVHTNTIYLWEKGVCVPSRRHLIALADKLGCRVPDLFDSGNERVC
ncbi:helix-turn-helix transcriptional regulator [Symbiobacterium thermophilum]|uniref:XRE family transcriptional regulator n=1 Tax=Symbiobacterium thermophilum TaxID=2734 RepID=A0A953IC15_SYMTR|nr:XRE family transcriptional regulator [Symbiobacterium thermophilum]